MILILTTVTPVFGASKVLVVYVDSYDSRDISIPVYVENDAKEFTGFIISYGFAVRRNLTVLENPTLEEFRTTLVEFLKRASSDDRLYIYFAGHSYYDSKSGKTFLLTRDTDPRDVPTTSLSLDDEFLSALKSCKARVVFIILDICHPGQIGGELRSGSMRYSLESVKKLFRSRRNVVVFVSNTPNTPTEVSQEYPQERVSLFTYYLISGLHGNAIRDHFRRMDYYRYISSGTCKEAPRVYVTVSEVAQYLANNLETATESRQRPVILFSDSMSDFPVLTRDCEEERPCGGFVAFIYLIGADFGSGTRYGLGNTTTGVPLSGGHGATEYNFSMIIPILPLHADEHSFSSLSFLESSFSVIRFNSPGSEVSEGVSFSGISVGYGVGVGFPLYIYTEAKLKVFFGAILLEAELGGKLLLPFLSLGGSLKAGVGATLLDITSSSMSSSPQLFFYVTADFNLGLLLINIFNVI